MTTRALASMAVIGLLAATALPTRCLAQQHNNQLPRYSVIDLGTLPGGTYSLAGGLSNAGWVEGFSTLDNDTALHAVLWRHDGPIDLGTMGGTSSDSGWRPNNWGDAGGGSDTATSDPMGEDFCGHGTNLICLPFLWRHNTGKMTPLPTLGGNNAWAAGVNDQDEVAGVSENTIAEPTCPPAQPGQTPQIFQWKPVHWSNGRIHALPTFRKDPVGEALAINASGDIVGWSGDCVNVRHALLWRNGKAIDLGNLGGKFNNEALDINTWGQVVGFSDVPQDATGHAFLWQWGFMIDLGTLPGDVGSSGDGINNWGQVVGGSYDADENSRAFLWQDGVMTDLNTLIPADSPLYLLEATGTINDAGEIAGQAVQLSTGEIHAFLLIPRYDKAIGDATNATLAVGAPRPHVTIPENVRQSLRRARIARFKGLQMGKP